MYDIVRGIDFWSANIIRRVATLNMLKRFRENLPDISLIRSITFPISASAPATTGTLIPVPRCRRDGVEPTLYKK